MSARHTHTQVVLRKGSRYIQAVYIPAKFDQVGTAIDYRIPTHVYFSCEEGKPCKCNLGWRLGWEVYEAWGRVAVAGKNVEGKTVQTTFVVKARRHEA